MKTYRYSVSTRHGETHSVFSVVRIECSADSDDWEVVDSRRNRLEAERLAGNLGNLERVLASSTTAELDRLYAKLYRHLERPGDGGLCFGMDYPTIRQTCPQHAALLARLNGMGVPS